MHSLILPDGWRVVVFEEKHISLLTYPPRTFFARLGTGDGCPEQILFKERFLGNFSTVAAALIKAGAPTEE